MFDFTSLSKTNSAETPESHLDLFSRLDRKATHISLRPAQASALRELDKQKNERDVVLKLSTGSGKTVAGLVYAEMMRRRYRGDPVIYLCPTTQLVDQVLQSAQAIGVTACTFPTSGLPYDALSGESVLVCTYDRLFNSRNVFESNTIRPAAIVLDDVHAGVERVRNCYTAQIPHQCYEPIKSLIQPICESSDPVAWRGITSNAHEARFEVPYWAWLNVYRETAKILDQHQDDKEMLFCWGNINRYLDLARVCISGTHAEISLPISPVEENLAYNSAKHRLFMSASIKDGSAFILDLDCNPAAFERVIEPIEDEGAGERMMLATSLISQDAKKAEIAEICKQLAVTNNVVVLTSSTGQAKIWTDASARLSKNKDFENSLETLRSSVGNFIVFPQRFDGVDLADNACRVLVIDGIPSGERLSDKIDSARQKDSPAYDVRTVNRFEQALGRAVRSSADYAAVFLVGTDIAAFIGKRSARALLEARSRVQIDLGKDLVKLTPGTTFPAAIKGLVQAVISRDEGWKETHRARVRTADRSFRTAGELTVHEKLAQAYRNSWLFAKARNFQRAVPALREACNIPSVHEVERAEILYRTASYLYQFDAAAAAEAYRAAFNINPLFPRPEQLVDKKFSKPSEQAVAMRDYFSEFSFPNAALARLDEIAAKLSFANSADIVEQGIHELGHALGAMSNRPEKETGRGPDNVWIFDNIGFCIEAKSENKSSIHKSDAAQLTLSHQWCKDNLPQPEKGFTPIFATNTTTADRSEDISFEPSLINEAILIDLLNRIKRVVLTITFDGPLFAEPASISKSITTNGLSGLQINQRLQKFST